ncbi:UNVERIFIED_CONTAM: E3 ubiquitin-protein ligase [Sesamum latifolium]|uniref:E3 ubiquitin-protein ligase n=1 Tax=Sesamum latifolium TaxID=2727402 RepID=A0AAW2UXS4_9LAMI
MASPIWLPPLNSHENFSLYVNIREVNTSDYFENSHSDYADFKRQFVIPLHVCVDFYSENDERMETMFPGLDISAKKSINVKAPQALEATLRERVLGEDLIPFPLHGCSWTEHHLHGRPIGLQLSDEDELVQRIFDFVCLVDQKIENEDLMLVEVTMEIRKFVEVPDEEFRSWIYWYDEQKRVDPNFGRNYNRAIGRPRYRNEIFQEAEALMARRPAKIVIEELDTVVVNSDDGGRGSGEGSSTSATEPCCICFEEFSDGEHGTRLPCGHMFHEDCILRWLRGNHVCPLCRYQLPV